MTYCVGIKLKAGLVLLSDTRTNAGVDNIARFRKMFVFEESGERVVALMAAGNLGVTQGVVTSISAAVKRSIATRLCKPKRATWRWRWWRQCARCAAAA